MDKFKNIIFGILRYTLASLLLVSGICLALVSGAMTFIMYTSNYSIDDVRYIVTGGLSIAMQLQVLLLSIGMPIIQQYAPHHRIKANILLYISFILSVIGSISFFSNNSEFSVGGEAIYNDVINQLIHIVFFGLMDSQKETFQTIIGIWAICFFVEFLVIFLPNLSISIFTGKYQKYVNHGLSIKDLLLICIFSQDKKGDLKKFIDIFLKPSIEKINSKLKEAENTKFIVDTKKVINLKNENKESKKGITSQEKVMPLVKTKLEKVTTELKKVMPNEIIMPLVNTELEKGHNSIEKSYVQNEKVITKYEKGNNSNIISYNPTEKKSLKGSNLLLVKNYLKENYKKDEMIKVANIKEKFNLSAKQWVNMSKKLKKECIIYTKGTATFFFEIK